MKNSLNETRYYFWTKREIQHGWLIRGLTEGYATIEELKNDAFNADAMKREFWAISEAKFIEMSTSTN